MIDLATEQRIGLNETAKLYPSSRKGRPTHISTPLRHITKGVRLANGVVVRLEGARLGGRWITSVEAVQRFMERLTAGALGDHSKADASSVRTTQQRRRELDRVDQELARAGF
jgi:Protein of unknown function (DUF1580)